MSSQPTHVCKQCHNPGSGNFCNHCGQAFGVKKITTGGIMHEVFHFFSHLEKGFPFTLRKLVAEPGKMQRLYIEGHRVKHQKPFSMYFLCATAAALIYYWINLAMVNWFHASNSSTVHFFHQYMVILQIILLPVYTLITWLFFRNSKYNFAETLVLLLYSFSVILLIASLLQRCAATAGGDKIDHFNSVVFSRGGSGTGLVDRGDLKR